MQTFSYDSSAQEASLTEMNSILETTLRKLPGGRVLDVAAGAGNFTAVMENCFYDCSSITAIDTAEIPLTGMAERLQSKKITTAVMSGALLAFRENSFNTVAISNSLHHLSNPGNVLREMLRTLIPGGHFIIREMFRDGNQTKAQMTHNLLHSWWAAVDSRNGIVHNQVFTKNELLEHAASAGLVRMEFHTDHSHTDDPFDGPVLEFLNRKAEEYLQKASDYRELLLQGELAVQHLNKHGFANASALLATGVKPG